VTKVRLANESDLPKIAEIHIRTMPKSINSALGSEQLVDVYEQTLCRQSVTILVAVDGTDILGFICGCSNYEDLYSGAKGSLSLRKAVQAYRALGLVALASEVIDLLHYLSKLKSLGSFFYMSNWAMLPTADPISGTLIFRAMLKRALSDCSGKVVVTVERRNHAMLKFYKKMGFEIATSTRRTLFLMRAC
jgi:ribosomal protein S18 acetylase RimI-like enzyme